MNSTKVVNCETYIDEILYKKYRVKISFPGYDISGEIVPWVRYLGWNRTQGTISPEKSYPFNLGTISRTHSIWVRFLLGTISPGYDFSSNPHATGAITTYS